MQRRLAAILAADVVGYSRLIRADEEGTLAALKSLRTDLIEPKFADHNGRVVKLMGDGILAEFPSVVDAVRAAIETQQAVPEHNAELPDDKRIEFRVGINLGDVVIDDDDIYGDGVNVAARLEALADAGGICVSGNVYDEVRDRTEFAFENLGEQEVKNINRPVQVWRWVRDRGVGRNDDASSKLRLPLPDKPSIAVLPFVNMSPDPEQEYFADGITEDIITALSNFRTFSVHSRNSTFVYKGKTVGVQDIGRQLNANYVLEGSVRRSGDKIRVTAQLIDVETDDHLWAKHYNGTLDDIFDLQDRITSTVVGTIEPELIRAEERRLQAKPPDSMLAYDWLLRGVAHMHKVTQEDTKRARECFENAIELSPNYGRAYAFASWTYRRDVDQSGFGSLPKSDQKRAVDLARKALRCDRNDPFVLAYAACTIALVEGNFEEALALVNQAVELNPNFHRFWNAKAMIHSAKGDSAEAIASADRAIEISPNDPAIWVSYWSIAQAHLQELRFEQAVEFARRAIRHNESVGPAYYILAAASAQLGRDEDADRALAAALKINPGMTLETFGRTYRVEQLKNLHVYLDGLRGAGLPE